ncbi:MAG: TOBE domain-containing protein [Gammaproteobacteria bacterium]|nr:TOBE domain-containing protein [Gammaproteobacteria bacterium]
MTITVNTRNQFRGTVVRINDVPVVSEVEVETPIGIITAVVTSSSIRGVDLQIGDEAVALFKATEVLIGKL